VVTPNPALENGRAEEQRVSELRPWWCAAQRER
jgi:hypothetical protein